jgi:hypothetical protein
MLKNKNILFHPGEVLFETDFETSQDLDREAKNFFQHVVNEESYSTWNEPKPLVRPPDPEELIKKALESKKVSIVLWWDSTAGFDLLRLSIVFVSPDLDLLFGIYRLSPKTRSVFFSRKKEVQNEEEVDYGAADVVPVGFPKVLNIILDSFEKQMRNI